MSTKTKRANALCRAVTMDPSKNAELKLLVDRNTDHVLFAEAGKDAVDFLYSLLGVPLGATAVSPLPAEEDMMDGCLGNLYASFLDLDSAHLVHGEPSSELLFPLIPSSSQSSTSQKYYRCSGSRQSVHGLDKYHWICCMPKCTSTTCTGDHLYFTDAYGTVCPSCREIMTTEMTLLDDAGERTKDSNKGTVNKDKGYVKGDAVFMVMDDLAVTPMGSVSEALDQLGVGDLSSLYELTVDLGPEEGLRLLKTSLCSNSKTVLTDVFLRIQKGDPPSK